MVKEEQLLGFRENLVKKIHAIIANLRTLKETDLFDLEETRDKPSQPGLIVFPSSSPTILLGLVGDNLTEYYNLIDELVYKKWWHDKLSWHSVEHALRQLIQEVTGGQRQNGAPQHSKSENEIIRDYLDDLLSTFLQDALKEWVAYVPLTGIMLSDERTCFRVGKAKLKAINDDFVKNLSHQIANILSKTTNPPSSKEALNAAVASFLVGFSGENAKVCAIYSTVGQEERAFELARRESVYVLDLLRYVFYNDNASQKPSIGIQGEVSAGFRSALLLSSPTHSVISNRERTNVGHMFFFPPTDEAILEKIGFDAISMIIKESGYSDIEKAILDGLHWFSMSFVQTKKEIELVCLTMCLECFFNPGKNEIVSAISEGCAILLRNDLTKRKELKERVREIYDCRSTIVHGGFVQRDVSASRSLTLKNLEPYLIDARDIANSLIATVVKRKSGFKTREGLREWIEDQKLSHKKQPGLDALC
ncbi:MAG: hypothetical protein WCB79_10595 [Halobacteriota archaeon]